MCIAFLGQTQKLDLLPELEEEEKLNLKISEIQYSQKVLR